MTVRKPGGFGIFYVEKKEMGGYKYLYYPDYQVMRRMVATPTLDLLLKDVKRI